MRNNVMNDVYRKAILLKAKNNCIVMGNAIAHHHVPNHWSIMALKYFSAFILYGSDIILIIIKRAMN